MIKIYVPKDSAARAVGADEVADAIVAEAASRKIDVQIIRNGSRGLLWLEPFVEVETPKGRVAFGGVEAGDVKSPCSIPSSMRAASTSCLSALPKSFPISRTRNASLSRAAALPIRFRLPIIFPMAGSLAWKKR